LLCKVTIYGESAGAMSVGVHMVSDLSKGLFQQALMQSNPFGLHYKTREFALAMGSKLASSAFNAFLFLRSFNAHFSVGRL